MDWIVLLHGWGGSKALMEPIAQGLDYSHILNLDLPSFGEEKELEIADFKAYVPWLREKLSEKGIKEPIFIAHSFGCRIALLYALEYPVKGMVLTGAAGIKDILSLKQRLKIYAYKISKKCHIPLRFGSTDYQNASDYQKKILVQAVNMDISDELHRITCPVLLVFGSYDQQTPLWMAKKLKDGLVNAELIVFEGGDHFAYLHEIQRFNRICNIFIKEVMA